METFVVRIHTPAHLDREGDGRLPSLCGAVQRAHPDLLVVADPVDAAETAVEVCRELRPDVVPMDVQLKGSTSGLEATRQIKKVSPSTKVVIVSRSAKRETLLVSAVEVGASEVVEQTEAVDQLDARERKTRQDVTSRLAALTRRKRQILGLMSDGLGSEALAGTLRLSVRTVETHVQNVLRKLAVHSKLEAVARGEDRGSRGCTFGEQVRSGRTFYVPVRRQKYQVLPMAMLDRTCRLGLTGGGGGMDGNEGARGSFERS